MALRSLGQSLIAKNKPGAALREQKTLKIQTPKIPEKGEVGTARRKLVQEPLERKASVGSEKVVTAKPTIEETALPGEVSPPASDIGLVGGNGKVVGFPGGAPTKAGGALTSEISPNVPFSPPSQASRVAPGGRTATAVSGGAAPGAAPAVANVLPVPGEQVTATAPTREDFFTGSPELPSLGLNIAGRAIAAPGEGGAPAPASNTFTPTTGQFVAGGIGSLINRIGQSLGNIFPEGGLSERLERFGGAASPAAAGRGSFSAPIRSLVGRVREGARRLRSRASDFRNRLRSFFNR